MSPADRFRDWIDSLSEAWKDRLRGWMISWATKGIVDALEDMTPEQKASVESITKELIDDPDTPPKVKAYLEQSTKKGNPLLVAAGVAAGLMMVLGLVTGTFRPIGRIFEYKQENLLHTYRLDPLTLTRVWLRDKPTYDKFWQDLRDQGWDDERVAIAKELSKIMPPLADMVRFADFSAFDPEVIAKWREFYDAPAFITEPFSLLGITNEAPRDWANKYWFSHYVQPGRYELGEMFRRSEGWKLGATPEAAEKLRELGVTEDDLTLAYRTMAYSEFWQKRLLELAKEVPTRVDIRRWWDMRTIDEPRLRELYLKRGYFGSDLEDYVLWTKVYVAFPDLMARWKNGWITEDDVRGELTGLGMPAERVQEMIETKIKPSAPERVSEELDLTKAEICAGVKKGVISRDEGIELLEDIGKSREEAEFILDVKVGAAVGSPETYPDFKEWTQRFRKAVGMPAKIPTEELKRAAAEVVRLTKDVAALKEAVETEQRGLVAGEVLPKAATKKLDELKVTLHRAEAELSSAQTKYNTLLAQWRHGE